MAAYVGELLGTALLILLGDGVVANVLLKRSKGEASGWIVITTGWALAVFVGVYAVAPVSGAHLNPAISVGMALFGQFPWREVPGYIVAQLLGAWLGAALVWVQYRPHWGLTENQSFKLMCFATVPAIAKPVSNLAAEIIGTFVLMLGVFLIRDAALLEPDSHHTVPIDLGAMGALPVALLVWAIGLSLGGPTGYAINPARDLGPRLAHALLPIDGKGPSGWRYAWIPIVGPLLGAAIAAGVYRLLDPLF